MSSKHRKINFTFEQENIGSLLFLDVKLCRKNGIFVTSVHRKPTFDGVFTNYESFIPTYQKRGLLHTLLHRSLAYVAISRYFILISNIWRPSSWETIISRILLIRVLAKSFLNKLYTPKVIVQNVLKRNIFVLEVLRFKVERSFKNYSVINWRLVI